MTGRRVRPVQTPRPDPVAALENTWHHRGAQALETMREYDPGAYVRLLAALVLDDDDLRLVSGREPTARSLKERARKRRPRIW